MQEQSDNIKSAAESWLGTPFFPHGTKKGPTGGCSCQTFAAGVYVESGLLPEGFAIPCGPLNAGYERILEFVSTIREFRIVDPPPQSGDLMLFKIGRVGHLAICLGDKLIHCLRNKGVHYSRADDATYLKRLTHVWRPRLGGGPIPTNCTEKFDNWPSGYVMPRAVVDKFDNRARFVGFPFYREKPNSP